MLHRIGSGRLSATYLLAVPCWLALSGCLDLFEQDEDLFIMGQMHLVTDAAEAPAGHTCSNVGSSGSGSSGSGSSGGGDESNDFWMSESSSREGHSVRVGSFDQLLEERFYDREFIAAHGVDAFTVTTLGGDTYWFAYWGGEACEPCPPASVELLAGNPWGCAGASSAPGSGEEQ
jgi:hypothetical protein